MIITIHSRCRIAFVFYAREFVKLLLTQALLVEEEVVHRCRSLVGVIAGPHCKEGGRAGPVEERGMVMKADRCEEGEVHCRDEEEWEVEH